MQNNCFVCEPLQVLLSPIYSLIEYSCSSSVLRVLVEPVKVDLAVDVNNIMSYRLQAPELNRPEAVSWQTLWCHHILYRCPKNLIVMKVEIHTFTIWFCFLLCASVVRKVKETCSIYAGGVAELSLLNTDLFCSALKIPDIWFAWGNLSLNFFFLIIPAVLHPIALPVTYRNEWQCAAHSQAVILVHYKSRFFLEVQPWKLSVRANFHL